jgi:hypothetical protein
MSCSLTCEMRNEVQQFTVVLGEGPIRTQKSCSLTCEMRKEIHQLGPGGTREPLRNPAAPKLGLRERGYFSEVAEPHQGDEEEGPSEREISYTSCSLTSEMRKEGQKIGTTNGGK